MGDFYYCVRQEVKVKVYNVKVIPNEEYVPKHKFTEEKMTQWSVDFVGELNCWNML